MILFILCIILRRFWLINLNVTEEHLWYDNLQESSEQIFPIVASSELSTSSRKLLLCFDNNNGNITSLSNLVSKTYSTLWLNESLCFASNILYDYVTFSAIKSNIEFDTYRGLLNLYNKKRKKKKEKFFVGKMINENNLTRSMVWSHMQV